MKNTIKEETIQLSYQELYDLLNNRRFKLKSENAAHSEELLYKVTFQKEMEELFLYSQIVSIELPNRDQIPYLKTLFGVPAGLVHVKQSPTLSFDSEERLQKEESNRSRYHQIRRSLLFATAWSVKAYERGAVLKALTWVLSFLKSEDSQLFRNLIVQVASNGRFPEQIFEKPSLSDTRYKGETNWLGIHLKNLGLLNPELREWYLEALKFERREEWSPQNSSLQTTLFAYLLTIGYHRANQFDAKLFKAWIEEHVNSEEESLLCTLHFLALLFEGAVIPQADNYYFAASAHDLMVLMELIALESEESAAPLIEKYLKKIEDSFSHTPSKEDLERNSVDYFKVKNPEISTLKFHSYRKGDKLEDTMLPLVDESTCNSFLKEQLVRWEISTYVNYDSFFWAKSKKAYETAVKNEQSVAFRDKKGVVSMSNVPEELIKNYYTPQQDVEALRIVNPNLFDSKEYLLTIQTDHDLTELEIKCLQLLFAEKGQPQKLLVLFSDVDVSREIGELNEHFNKAMGRIEVKVIRHLPKNPIWEFVYLGQQQLHRYRYRNILFTDWRRVKYNDAENIVRILSDVVYYEPHLAYNFMNLNILN